MRPTAARRMHVQHRVMQREAAEVTSGAAKVPVGQQVGDALKAHPLIAVSAATAAGVVAGAITRRSTDSSSGHSSGLVSKLVSILAAAALRHGVKTAIARLTDEGTVSRESAGVTVMPKGELESTDVVQLKEDAADLVRRNPKASLAIGVGLGFLASRLLSR